MEKELLKVSNTVLIVLCAVNILLTAFAVWEKISSTLLDVLMGVTLALLLSAAVVVLRARWWTR